VFRPVSDNMALSQKIIAQISDAIAQGELHPGDRIPPERELAEQFGVSRTALRDAIKILSGGGVLEVRHGVGIFVSTAPAPSEDVAWRGANLTDLFEIRQVLETQAAAWAAERGSEEYVARLTSIIEDAKLHTDDLAILATRDAQFHMAMAEAGQNLLLVKVMWNLLDALAAGREASLAIPNRPLASLKEHEEIVAAITTQNVELARLCMRNHLQSVKQAIVTSGIESR